MEFSFGSQVTTSKVTTKWIIEVDTERCTGTMDLFTKETGKTDNRKAKEFYIWPMAE